MDKTLNNFSLIFNSKFGIQFHSKGAHTHTTFQPLRIVRTQVMRLERSGTNKTQQKLKKLRKINNFRRILKQNLVVGSG